jgi:hypothetical protein
LTSGRWSRDAASPFDRVRGDCTGDRPTPAGSLSARKATFFETSVLSAASRFRPARRRMATLLTRRRRRAPSRSTFLRTLAPRFPSFVLLLRAPPVSPRVASASFAASRRLFPAFVFVLGRLVFFAPTVSGASPPRAAALGPRGAFFGRGLGDLGGVTGGDVPVPGDPGDGGEAARRFGCRTARETRPCVGSKGWSHRTGGMGGRSANRAENDESARPADCVDERECGTASRERRSETYPARRRRRAPPPSSAWYDEVDALGRRGRPVLAPRARECAPRNSALGNNHVFGFYEKGSVVRKNISAHLSCV